MAVATIRDSPRILVADIDKHILVTFNSVTNDTVLFTFGQDGDNALNCPRSVAVLYGVRLWFIRRKNILYRFDQDFTVVIFSSSTGQSRHRNRGLWKPRLSHISS